MITCSSSYGKRKSSSFSTFAQIKIVIKMTKVKARMLKCLLLILQMAGS